MFRAYDATRERLVAVKLFTIDLPPERAHQLVAAFERLIAVDLTHPAIAAPVATGIAVAAPYLAVEYVAAESLDLVVRERGRVSPADAVRVATQLAGALDAAAVVNMAHGALHPRDVLLSADQTRITGLGIARALEQVGIAAPIRRPYTPPERIAGAPWDRRADVFSLAALTHELLWGRRIAGTGAQASNGLMDIDGGAAAALRDAFARALADNPAERYATALELVDALKKAFPGESRKSQPPTNHRRRAPESPRLPLDEPDARPNHEPIDLDLHAAEHGRYEEIEVAPAIVKPPVEPPIVEQAASPLIPPGLITGHEPEPLSVLERSRSAVWPLVLALGIGLAMGFAGGYGIGTRDRATANVSAGVPPAGHEYTESTVRLKPDTTTTIPSADVAPKADATTNTPRSSVQLQPDPHQREGGGVRLQPDTTTANATATAAVTHPGRLLVRSTPAGAHVFVDGRDSGVTPVAVRNLGRGTHRVRVARDGYATEQRHVVITKSRPAQSMTVALARPRAPASHGAPSVTPAATTPGTVVRDSGALSVESRPTGAKVYLDGKLVGATPLALTIVPAGEHTIRLERDGYRRWSSSVRVAANESSRVTASLER